MRRFIKRIIFFTAMVTIGATLVLCLTTWWVSSRFDYKIPNDKNILVLGDSHTQCAIDTKLYPQLLNLSESADTYFYSYVKLKKILEHNKAIDTLIIGYSHNNVSKAQDNWLTDDAINGFKLPVYFFLFEQPDLAYFAKAEPMQLVKNVPGIIKRNFSHASRIRRQAPITAFGIGNYKAIDHQITASQFEKTQRLPQQPDSNLGTQDIMYLRKIYDRCQQENIKVILLAPPVLLRKIRENPFYIAEYNRFAQQEMPLATKLNLAGLRLPTACFADAAHLNKNGASQFTVLLKKELNRR